MTTGSPLRHHAFRDVAREEGLAQWSRNHRSTPWINVDDKADPATKGTKLKTDDLGSLIQISVDNKAVGSGHHSGSAHLQHPAVARAILAVARR